MGGAIDLKPTPVPHPRTCAPGAQTACMRSPVLGTLEVVTVETLLASPPHNGLLSLLLGKMPIPVQPLKGSGMKQGSSKVRKPCWRHLVVLPKFRFGEVGRAPILPSTKHSKHPWHPEKEGTPPPP